MDVNMQEMKVSSPGPMPKPQWRRNPRSPELGDLVEDAEL